ncbi:MAG: hypothetical protein Q8836_02590, partial [Sweet potato little leaf phytoplasma]|nr:hypothetical protein [Sweet potato little leaf phytoplasma]
MKNKTHPPQADQRQDATSDRKRRRQREKLKREKNRRRGRLNKKIIKEKIDVTLPGFSFPEGSIHPLT